MRRYETNRDEEWRVGQVMTNEKKFSHFLLEIEYNAATYPEFVRDPEKARWGLKIITNHCPTCEHQLEEGDKRGTVTLMVDADTEYREGIKFLKKYFKGTYDKWEDYPKHLRDLEIQESEGHSMSLMIHSKHYHYDYNHATMKFENKKELEDFLNFLETELKEAKSIQEEEYVRCREWHDNIEKQRREKA